MGALVLTIWRAYKYCGEVVAPASFGWTAGRASYGK